ncbi:MAG: hypothetical protein AAF597_10200 [Bacteroidota bacterium]
MDTLDPHPEQPKPTGIKFALISFLSPLVVVGCVYFLVFYGPLSRGKQPEPHTTPFENFLHVLLFTALLSGIIGTFFSFRLREKRGWLKYFGLVLNLLISLPIIIALIYSQIEDYLL